MVILKGPMHSQKASGVLGDAIQFETRRGRHVAGKRRRPRQPRTEAQRATRLWMTWLSQQWHLISAADQATWLNYEDSPLLSPYTAYIKYNTDRFKNQPGLHTGPDTFHVFPSTAYPATENTQGGNPADHEYIGGVHQITHNFTMIWQADTWFWNYHRISAEHPECVYANLVHIETVDQVAHYSIVIKNLPAGDVTLRYARVSHTGLANLWYRSFTVTVTD